MPWLLPEIFPGRTSAQLLAGRQGAEPVNRPVARLGSLSGRLLFCCPCPKKTNRGLWPHIAMDEEKRSGTAHMHQQMTASFIPRYSLHDRRFVMEKNGNGPPVPETVFSFVQEDRMIRGEFEGDTVAFGQVLGLYLTENQIRLRLQWISRDQKMHSGTICGLVSGDGSRGLTLFLNWQDGNNPQERGWASFRELEP